MIRKPMTLKGAFGVGKSLGKGEVESSILSHSTIIPQQKQSGYLLPSERAPAAIVQNGARTRMVKSHNPCTPPGALTPHGNAIAELVSEGYREGGFFLAARGLCFWGMHAQTLVHPEGWTYAEYPDEVLAAISAAKDNQRMGAALMALGKVHCPRDDHEFEGTDWWAHYLAEYRDEIQQTGVIPDAWRIERDADGDPVLVAVEVVHTQRLTQAKLSAYWRLERILYSDARAALDLRVMYVGAHAHGRAMVSVDLEAGAPA